MLLSRFRIVGHSMEPTLIDGNFALISNIPYLFVKPKVGNIIAFKVESKIFIKRIAKVNGEKYFVKGDNERDSLDSVKFGWIDKKEIIGKVIFKISNYSNF